MTTKICPHCGHKTNRYKHRLNKGLANALEQLCQRYIGNPINLQKDLILTKNQYNNFQKLQYFGLVKRTKHGWYPTNRAMLFVKGNTTVLDTAITEGKEIIELTEELKQEYKIKSVKITDYIEINYDKYRRIMEQV